MARNTKAELRRLVRERLGALSPQERRDRGAKAIGRLLALPEVTEAGVVLLFRSLPDEIDTTVLFERLLALGKEVYAPRTEGVRLRFVRVRVGTAWIRGGSPAEEPDSLEPVPTAKVVAVVPGIAFSPTGARLGRGRGHYDRALAAPPLRGMTTAIGLALEEQLLEDLPAETHDTPVHIVVTDHRVLRCASDRS